MRRLQAEHYLLALFGLAIVVLIVLWYHSEQDIRSLQGFESRLETSEALKPDVKLEVRLPAINPHAVAISKIETDVGMKLSRVASLIIADEGERTRPYSDSKGNPTIGVGRNLSGNGVSISELKAIAGEIDYDLVLRESHVQNGRVRIGSLDLANRIFVHDLTEYDVGLLLTDDLKSAQIDAVRVFGAGFWANITEPRKEALLDVIFALGLPHFKKFEDMIAAVKAGNWNDAATELLKSEAADEAPGRFFRNYYILKNNRYLEVSQ